jgi:copper chaperone
MDAITIKVKGMTCQGCVHSVTSVLQAVPGVDAVHVSLATGDAQVSFDPAKTNVAELAEMIEEAGFEAAIA